MLLASRPRPVPGMGFIDPISAVSSILTPISNYFVAKEQNKTAKKQIELQAKALKTQKEQDARDFAYAQANMQAEALTSPDEAKRKEQVIILSAVGGAAILISALFILGATKAGRE